jgi:uncharacterized lipoprotein YajG
MKLLTLLAISCLFAGCAGVSTTISKSTPYGDVSVHLGSDGKTSFELNW